MSPEQRALEKFIEEETRKFALSDEFLERFEVRVYDREITKAEVKELRSYQPLAFPDIDDLYCSDLRQPVHPVGNGDTLICCVLDAQKKVMAGMGMLTEAADKLKLYYLLVDKPYRRYPFANSTGADEDADETLAQGADKLVEWYKRNKLTSQNCFVISSRIRIGISDVIIEQLKELLDKPCIAETNGQSFRLLFRHGFEEKGGMVVVYTPERLRNE